MLQAQSPVVSTASLNFKQNIYLLPYTVHVFRVILTVNTGYSLNT